LPDSGPSRQVDHCVKLSVEDICQSVPIANVQSMKRESSITFNLIQSPMLETWIIGIVNAVDAGDFMAL